jgi:hypothetical protein
MGRFSQKDDGQTLDQKPQCGDMDGTKEKPTRINLGWISPLSVILTSSNFPKFVTLDNFAPEFF